MKLFCFLAALLLCALLAAAQPGPRYVANPHAMRGTGHWRNVGATPSGMGRVIQADPITDAFTGTGAASRPGRGLLTEDVIHGTVRRQRDAWNVGVAGGGSGGGHHGGITGGWGFAGTHGAPGSARSSRFGSLRR